MLDREAFHALCKTFEEKLGRPLTPEERKHLAHSESVLDAGELLRDITLDTTPGGGNR